MSKLSKNRFIAIQAILIIGMLVSLFLVYEHFSSSASKYCSFGANLDCGVVNKSPYANVNGIFYLLVIDFGLNFPFADFLINISNPKILDLLTSQAFLGFLTLVLMSTMTIKLYQGKSFFQIKNSKILLWLRGIATLGIINGFYLLLIQHFILKTYCIFCLALDVTLLTLTIIFYSTKKDG